MIDQLSRFSRLETPFYYYDLNLLKRTADACMTEAGKHGFHVHYALKANVNDPILEILRQAGMGADCVSGGEVEKAVSAGFPLEKVVFAGVGKTDREIRYALEQDIFCFNVESVQELRVIDGIAAGLGKKARIALRINPNVNAHTHQYITTGLEENKFGINSWEFDAIVENLRSLQHVECVGLHFHVGSQIMDLNVFKSLCVKVSEFQQWFNDREIRFRVLNVGGGLGVDYHQPDEQAIPDFGSYFKVFSRFLEVQPGQEVHFELGRSLVAQCGSLITRVVYVKNGVNTNFAIVDAGMTELIRPMLYHAYHKIENLTKDETRNPKPETRNYDVVGPICESSDCFGKSVPLPETERGDLIAIRTAGAYGQVMASGYNLRPKVREVYD